MSETGANFRVVDVPDLAPRQNPLFIQIVDELEKLDQGKALEMELMPYPTRQYLRTYARNRGLWVSIRKMDGRLYVWVTRRKA